MDPITPNLQTPPITPPTPKPSMLPLILSIFLIISLAGIGILVYQNKQLQKQISTLRPQPTPSPTPTPPADPAANWKTYSNEQFGFSIRYPSEWQVQESHNRLLHAPFYGGKTSDTVKFYSDNAYIQFSSNFVYNDGTPSATQVKKEQITISGKNATKTTYTLPNQRQETTFVDIEISNANPYRIKEIFPSVESSLIDQILSTFKFLSQTSDPEGRFCGGIVPKLPQNICPDGYTCKEENNYPDAGGVCVKTQQGGEGNLKATVMRSPTCPGAQKPGEICEAPVTNETFNIFRVESTQTIQPKTKQDIRDSAEGLVKKQTVTTDAAGQFTVTLEAGSYQIRNTVSGIGKDIGNRDFTIVAGQTTTQRFTIDTGIR